MCGRAATWWDEQIKDRINTRQRVYKKFANGRKICEMNIVRSLRTEIKYILIEKKLNI